MKARDYIQMKLDEFSMKFNHRTSHLKKKKWIARAMWGLAENMTDEFKKIINNE